MSKALCNIWKEENGYSVRWETTFKHKDYVFVSLEDMLEFLRKKLRKIAP